MSGLIVIYKKITRNILHVHKKITRRNYFISLRSLKFLLSFLTSIDSGDNWGIILNVIPQNTVYEHFYGWQDYIVIVFHLNRYSKYGYAFSCLPEILLKMQSCMLTEFLIQIYDVAHRIASEWASCFTESQVC